MKKIICLIAFSLFVLPLSFAIAEPTPGKIIIRESTSPPASWEYSARSKHSGNHIVLATDIYRKPDIQPNKWNVELQVGISDPTHSSQRNIELDSGTMLSAEVSALVGKNVAFGIFTSLTNYGVSSYGINRGDIEVISFGPFLKFRPSPIEGKLQPYGLIGLAVNSNKFDGTSGKLVCSVYKHSSYCHVYRYPEVDLDSSQVGIRLSGGLDYHVNKQVALNGEIRYVQNDGLDLDLSSISYLLGIHWYF